MLKTDKGHKMSDTIKELERYWIAGGRVEAKHPYTGEWSEVELNKCKDDKPKLDSWREHRKIR